jgi:hypothetical protein
VVADRCAGDGIVSLNGDARELDLKHLSLVKTKADSLAQISFFGDFRVRQGYFLELQGELAVSSLGIIFFDGCWFDRPQKGSPFIFFVDCTFDAGWPDTVISSFSPNAQRPCTLIHGTRTTLVVPATRSPSPSPGLLDFPTSEILVIVGAGGLIILVGIIICCIISLKHWRGTVIRKVHMQYAEKATASPPLGPVERGLGKLEVEGDEIEYEIDPGVLAVWDTDDDYGGVAGGKGHRDASG